ncbi:hypothetical protein [Angustibacter speluncae]
MTENDTTTDATLVTRWEKPSWATGAKQFDDNIRWTRTPMTTAFRTPENATEQTVPVPVEVEAYQNDWVALGPVGVSVERDAVEVLIGGDSLTVTEARKLAAAILEVCDAVELS